MTTATAAQLEELKNRATRYEVVLVNSTGLLLLGYTARKSREGLMQMMRARGPRLVAFTLMPADAVLSAKCWNTTGVDLGFDGWRVKFTGRTQREAVIAGEHTFIGFNAEAVR